MNAESPRIFRDGAVPFHNNLLALTSIHERNLRERHVWILEGKTHQVAEVANFSEDALPIEQVGVVFEPAVELVVLIHLDREVKFRDAGFEGQFLHLKPGDFEYLLRNILEGEHHLEQRSDINGALRRKLFDQSLEGNILVG